MKKLLFSQRSETPHWVGDGFPVRSMFNYNDQPQEFSPFLLMDYGGPAEFKPSTQRRGVGEHPHRGFETVTIVYEGQVEHRDSAGGGGVIGPGDVQWMTAASGLVHEEKHGEDFTKTGGLFEMVQLWVNLPAKDKMSKPKYQGIKNEQIPVVNLANGAGTVRIIAGEFQDTRGPASTFSPVNLWDIRLNSGKTTKFTVPEGHTTSIFVLSGTVKLNSGEELGAAEIAILERKGTEFELTASTDAKVLFLGGEPLNEPVIGYGPFVMNTQAEIMKAFQDYEQGRMGQLVQ